MALVVLKQNAALLTAPAVHVALIGNVKTDLILPTNHSVSYNQSAAVYPSRCSLFPSVLPWPASVSRGGVSAMPLEYV